MNTAVKVRIDSIDLLRGIVMVIMALDHTRDYFHLGATVSDPADMATTKPVLFFTRLLSHYCAPVFVLLTGTAAYLSGRNKSKNEVFRFLFTRGLWLIFLEFALNNFIWFFDFSYSVFNIQVIWAIGFSMICLSLLIYLPYKAILAIGIVIVAGHNLLDPIRMEGKDIGSIIWYLLHQMTQVDFNENKMVYFQYAVIPWIGVMALGYCLGSLYSRGASQQIRKKWLLYTGLSGIALFLVIRGINVYGDPAPWQHQKSYLYTLMSFLNVTKYPPSLSYLLLTLSPALLILYATETIKNRISAFFIVFGKVPLFYYFIHVLVIHILAMFLHAMNGGDWYDLVLTRDVFVNGNLKNYGYALWIVYEVWAFVILLLYPLCRAYMLYKSGNRQKWWLSYL